MGSKPGDEFKLNITLHNSFRHSPSWGRDAAASVTFLLFFFVTLYPPSTAADSVGAGRRLADMIYNRPDGHDMRVHAKMVLIDQGHDARERDMYIYRLKKKPGEVWSLIRFTSPATIDGTGLLTLDDKGKDTEQWVYLPALDRARRISSSRKGGRFVGSDIYYEDNRDREVDMDNYKIIGEAVQGGVRCKVLESIPVDRDSSVYSKRISWVDPKTLIPLRIDYYEGGSTPSKRLTVKHVEKIQGYDTVTDSTMTDLKGGHETRVTLQKVVYDSNLPDGLFTRHALTDPEFAAGYRP